MSEVKRPGGQGPLAEAFRLLLIDPGRAGALCRSVLSEGTNPSASLMLAGALRLQGDCAAALSLAGELADANPRWAGAAFERAMALARLGRAKEALEALEQAGRLGPLPGLWREIGDQHWALGEKTSAEAAYLRHIGEGAAEPLVRDALAASAHQDRAQAETLLRRHLVYYPADPLALRLLAEQQTAAGCYDTAIPLLERCLERAPSFALARFGLALSYLHEHESGRALAHVDALLSSDPVRLECLKLKAEALTRLGRFEDAVACLEWTAKHHPREASVRANLGHALRALGRREQCEAAYRQAIALNPGYGDAYWGLANLKTFRFSPDEGVATQAAAQGVDQPEHLVPLLFALAKSQEDQDAREAAFQTYARANAIHRARNPHAADQVTLSAQRARSTFTREFLDQRRAWGCSSADPIFVVGMPRSGSTLVEQILASHSAIEGTMELVDLMSIAKRLEAQGDYPERLLRDSKDLFRSLGEEYLARTRVYRRTNAARFIDKMPNNFLHTGLILSILPKAVIVDVRRHPMACCWSIFRQHWATGQSFAYDLVDIGRYYRDYVQLMGHFETAAPGRVHRVHYESLVAETENEVRRLIDACGLDFEPACLRFHENRRAVWTPSSEQVRRPISAEGLEAWRAYEPWLAPLKEALGPALEYYPATPPSDFA